MSVMTSMEMDDDQKLDMVCNYPGLKDDKPEYPYGLRICLTGPELDKLGLSLEEAFLGGIIHGHFLGKITSLSQNISEDSDSSRVEIQITALCIESEDAENQEY